MFSDTLILTGLLFIGVLNSWRNVYKKNVLCKFPNVFATFYSLVWSTLLLTIILYIWLTTAFRHTDAYVGGSISFVFLPNILMVLCYALLYHQLELMTTESRIQSSQHYVNRLRQVKFAHFVKMFSFVMICLCVSA